MRLLLKAVIATNLDTGEDEQSQIMVCPKCLGENFVVFVMDANVLHYHMQCTRCDHNVCGGSPDMELEPLH